MHAARTLAFAFLAAAATAAVAQTTDRIFRPTPTARAGELVFYSGANFTGRSFTVTGARTSLNLGFSARSFQVARGEAWQVCARSSYRTPCVTLTESNYDRGLASLSTIRSARPIANNNSGGEFSGSGAAGPTLQGMASQFFRAPEDRGSRVLACRTGSATSSCAAATADRFCRARGYAGGSAYERLETVSSRVYLADVLCSRSAT